MKLRHQLSAYSPVRSQSLVAAGLSAVGMRKGSGEALRNHVMQVYGADDCFLVGSGTQALQCAIEIAARAAGPGGFVAMPAFSCYDVASAAIGAGMPVALYDVDPLTLSPDLSSFDRVLAAGASVGVIAPLYGIPVDWEALADLGRRYGVPLVEDASQGHGAFRENAMIGALGSLSTLSFGRGKGWTGGAGGAVLMRGSRSFESSSLSSLGRLAEIRGVAGLLAQWALGRPAVYGVPRSIPLLALGETRYHAPIPPTPMTAGAAAAVLCNESASLKEASLRRDNAACLLAAVRGTGLTAIEVPAGWTAGYMRLPLLVPASADGLPSAAIELGAARSYPTPLSTLPALTRQLVVGEKAWPGAVRLARELITLPTHSRLTVAERRRLLEVIKRWTVSGGLSVRLHA